MTPDRWRRVQDVFLATLEQESAARRAAYLSSQCMNDPELRGEVESLLRASDEAGEFLEESALAQAAVDRIVGTRVGPYRILEELGHGGMGTVYRAVRDDGQYNHEVAIKLVRRGMDTEAVLQRFRHERQMLAFLNHAAIARLLDGNSTEDGRPYFVMELVDGRPITDYSQDRKLNLPDRLRLFQQVCSAVAYAHRNLIVHRDLKPENVLVNEDGMVKLLDFGIAKLLLSDLRQHTLTGNPNQKLLTPNYASPEQVRGEPVNTATDVYSLGVLLYQLITGTKPYDIETSTPGEMERLVCQEDPRKPSLAIAANQPYSEKELRGDLDNIVLKALQKEPARRYLTVEQFSEDIERHLGGWPVLARPDSVRYRTARYIRRNRGRVVAGALIAATLVGGVIATAWQARVARQERKLAERRFQDVRRLANGFLVDGDTVAALPGGTAVRAKFIERALRYLDGLNQEVGNDPSLQEELALAYEKMGDAQGRRDGPNLGDTKGALKSYAKAIALRESLLREQAEDRPMRRQLVRVYGRYSGALKIAGEYKQGLEYDRKTLAERQALLAADPQDRTLQREVAANLTLLGESLFQVADWDGVLDFRRQALTAYQQLLTTGTPSAEDYLGLSLANTRMGTILVRRNDLTGALGYYQAAVATANQGFENFPAEAELRQRAATALQAMGTANMKLSKPDEALNRYREAHGIYVSLHAADSHDFRRASLLAFSHFRLGQALLKKRATADALREFQTSLQMRKDLAAKNPMNAGARSEIGESYGALGDTYAAINQREQARRWYQEAHELLTDLVKQGKANTATREELERVDHELAKLQSRGTSS